MAKLFIGIALVVMLATAALSFLAKGNIDKLQTSLRDTKGRIAAAEGQAKTAKVEEEKAKKDAKDAGDKLDEANKVVAAKTKAAEDAQKALDETKIVIDGKDKEIADLNKKIADGKGIPPEVVDQLKAQVAELTTQKENAVKERDEAKALFEAQIAKAKDTENKLAELEKINRDRGMIVGRAGLQGRILAVNAGWNFVVLSVGDKQGVVVNAPLLVVRGNQPIAKLRITSVEPSTSIADVLPGSVPRGVTVQPGDTVIFQGRTSALQPPDIKPGSDASGSPPPPAQPPITAPQ